MRALAECQSVLLPQFSAQLVQLQKQQCVRRAAIIDMHRRTHEHHLSVYAKRTDVAELHRLQSLAAAVRADCAAGTQRLAELRASLRQVDDAAARAQRQHIVGLAGEAVRLRDVRRRIASMVGRHRQLRERIVQRQQLLQCLERRRQSLQERLHLLKQQQTHAFFFDHIDSVAPIELTDVASADAAAVEATSNASQPIAASAGDDIETELDQLNISGQPESTNSRREHAEPEPEPELEPERRVRFNPTNSVRAIAAIGAVGGSSSSQASGSDRVYHDMSTFGVSGRTTGANANVPIDAELDDIETEPLRELNSNDSFMCELANAAKNGDRIVSTTPTTDGHLSVVAEPNRGANVDLNNTIVGIDDYDDCDDDDLNDAFLRDGFQLFGDKHDAGKEANDDGAADPALAGDQPPSKRAKLTAQAERTEYSQNQSFRSMAACSEFDFEFAGFEEMEAAPADDSDDVGLAAPMQRGNVTSVSRASSLFCFDVDFNAAEEGSDLF